MSQNRPTILLADDDPTITDNLPPFLERAGFHVLAVSNGMEALEKARSHQPELIILDVLMPLMDGREVLRRLRSQNIWIPTILLTQIGASTERAIALEEGADDYLNKPFDPHELLAQVHAVTRRTQTGKPSLSTSWHLTAGDLALDRRARRASLADMPLDLSPKAFAVLEYLMTHPGGVIPFPYLLWERYKLSVLEEPASTIFNLTCIRVRQKPQSSRFGAGKLDCVFECTLLCHHIPCNTIRNHK